VHDVVRAELGQAVAELVDEALVVTLRHRVLRTGVQGVQDEAGREESTRRVVGGRPSRDDVDLVAERRERLRLVQHDDVHPARVASARVLGG
jgi:hypothetical protein